MALFPTMIPHEPPPIDTDDDDDSDLQYELRTNGLHLDISSEPSPMASPWKTAYGTRLSTERSTPSPLLLPVLDLSPNTEANDASSVNVDLVSSCEDDQKTNGVDPTPNEEHTNSHVVPSQNPNNPPLQTSCIKPNVYFNNNCVIRESLEGEIDLQFRTKVTEIQDDVRRDSGDIDKPSTTRSITPEIDIDVSNSWHHSMSKLPDSENPTNSNVLDGVSSDVLSSPSDFPPVELYQTAEDDDFGDFDSAQTFNCDFGNGNSKESTPDLFPVVEPSSCEKMPKEEISEEQQSDEADFGDFTSNEFADSPHPFSPHFNQFQSTPEIQVASSLEEDDFGEFSMPTSKEVANSEPVLELASSRRESLPSNDKFSTILQSVLGNFGENIPLLESSESTTLEIIDKQLEIMPCNLTWKHVQDFEESCCLRHKWGRSNVQELLLKSLKIDSSTIIYSAKYGTIEVPKFATSLVDIPLQPQPVGSFQCTEVLDSPKYSDGNEDTPNEMESQASLSIEKESRLILEQLPDLSYMLAKSLVFPRNPKY